MLVNSGTHSGEILKDSPGTWQAVLRDRRLSGEKLAAAYRLVCRYGGLEERAVRGVGVSFNPRPTRVLSLRLQYHPTLTDAEGVLTLLTSALQPIQIEEPLLSIQTSALTQFLPVARGLLGLEPLSKPEVTEQVTTGLLTAHLLDSIRHLHLWQGGLEERSSIIQYGREIGSGATFSDEPLIPLLRTALEQQQRILESEPR